MVFVLYVWTGFIATLVVPSFWVAIDRSLRIAEAKRVFGALGEGGQVDMPLARTFFSSSFGTLKDRFGVTWMILAQPKEQPRRN
jgi:uncharacterized glyoxalase superfamily protein PhnB